MTDATEDTLFEIPLYGTSIAVSLAVVALLLSVIWACRQFRESPIQRSDQTRGLIFLFAPAALFWLDFALMRVIAAQFDPPLQSPQTIAFAMPFLFAPPLFAIAGLTVATISACFHKSSLAFSGASLANISVPVFLVWLFAA